MYSSVLDADALRVLCTPLGIYSYPPGGAAPRVPRWAAVLLAVMYDTDYYPMRSARWPEPWLSRLRRMQAAPAALREAICALDELGASAEDVLALIEQEDAA